MHNNRSNTSLSIIQILFLIFAYLYPLIYSPFTRESFELPKILTLGVFVVLLSLCVSLGLRSIRFNNWATVFVLSFLGSVFVSTIFSEHALTSVYGYNGRFIDGLFHIFGLTLFYFSGRELFARSGKGYVGAVLKVMVLGLLVVSIVGIYQGLVLGVDRIYSTLGQPVWLAQYLAMLLPYALLLFLTEKSLLWAIILQLGYMCLWLTFSLSGLFSFIIGILLVAFLVHRKRIPLNTKTSITLGIMSSLALIFSLVVPGIFTAKLADIKADIEHFLAKDTISSTVSSVAKPISTVIITHEVSDPAYIRFSVWRGAVLMPFVSPKKFVLGYGPEVFPYYFPKYRDVTLNYSSEWNYLINKPHNYYLELFIEQGILGLGLFSMATLGLLIVSFRTNKLILPALGAMLVSILFGWISASAYVLFYIFLILYDQNY